MLLPSVLLSLAAAAAPAAPLPMIPEGASSAVHIPRPDKVLSSAAAFLTSAHGFSKSAWLSPAAISQMFQPSLGADLFSPESLAAAGIDTERPITLSLVQGQWVACFYQPKITVSFEMTPGAASDASRLAFSGVTAEDGTWRRGTLSFEDRLCATEGPTDAKKILELAQSTLLMPGKTNSGPEKLIASTGKLSSPTHVIAAFQIQHQTTVASFQPKSGTVPALEAEGRVIGAGKFLEPPKAKSKAAALPGRPAETPVWAELTLSSQSLTPKGETGRAVQRLIRHLAPNMPPDARNAALQELLSSMTGRMRFAVTGVDGKQPTGSIHQIQQAVFAEVKDAAALQKAIAAFAGSLSKPPANEASPITKGGAVGLLSYKPVWFGIQGDTFYFGNDAKLIRSALALKGGPPAGRGKKDRDHSLTLRVDGPAAAEALKSVSLFDMANGSLFGALFMVKSEFSGLLRNSWLELHAAPLAGGDLAFDAQLSLEREPECPCQKGQ